MPQGQIKDSLFVSVFGKPNEESQATSVYYHQNNLVLKKK